MKKYYWLFILLIVLFIGDRVGGSILNYLLLKSNFRYSRLYNNEAKSEVLFIGNSRGLVFYKPYIDSAVNFTSFNFSYNGLPLNLGKVLLFDYFKKYNNPRKIILEVTMYGADKELTNNMKMFMNHSPGIDSLITSISPKTANYCDVSHLYRYNGEVFERSMFYMNKTDDKWILDKKISQRAVAKINSLKPVTLSYNDLFLENLTLISNYCKNNSIELVLIINPYYPEYTNKFKNLETWKSGIEKATGLKIHDYSNAISEPSAFADYYHLNKSGSKLFIKKLIDDNLLN